LTGTFGQPFFGIIFYKMLISRHGFSNISTK
jgi:hypothetical protein